MSISTAVSDLFFMVDNSGFFNDDASESHREETLRKNAEDFAFLINSIKGNEPDSDNAITADMVIDDFKGRI